jgi:AraC family transcriptional regulator, regulatory protein of adaptative response / methylated-DNA-[protein]-cysteine methyltransferase
MTRPRLSALREVIRYALGSCSFGPFLVGSTEKGICVLTLGAKKDVLLKDLRRRFKGADFADGGRFVKDAKALIDHPSRGSQLPLDLRGTPFQKKVWQALLRIPAGKTASYAEIAKAVGKPKAVRAVAQACGANHIAVFIPCHRVVRSDGSLSGYRWGTRIKAALLESERMAD